MIRARGPGRRLSATVAGLFAALLVAGCSGRATLTETGQTRHETGQARYKVGNPYVVSGVLYHPREDYAYAETGIASWYGPKFHGRLTANGEIFDMNAVSAAHKTLPLPSVVRVTHLANGRSLVIRVNDRGPFVDGRIIDLSRRAADLLGVRRSGTATVRVEILAEESRHLKRLAQAGRFPALSETPPTTRRVAALPGDPPPRAGSPVRSPRIFVQAGAFADRARAARALSRLGVRQGAEILEGRVGEREIYRVRIGPLPDVADAQSVMRTVVSAGFPEAFVVVD